MERMEAEADELGADGIVAVRLTLSVHAWGTNIIEFLAIGTAVQHVGARRARSAPATASRSRATSRARTSGHCSTRATGRSGSSWATACTTSGLRPPQQAANGELPHATQALYDARELAMERMQFEAEALKAEGIVGVLVDETNHTWGPSVLEFSAVGTAVIAVRADHQIPRPSLVLSVSD